MYRLCSQAMSVKEVNPVKFCPLSLSYIARLFRFYYFCRFCHLERGIKSLRLEVTSCDLHWFLFCWRIWPLLLLPGRTCRTAWTILWTARLLSKSDHGMATPELMEVYNDDDVVHIINCVALYYEKGASGNAFLREEKFRAAVSRQVKTLKVLKETVRWVDLILLLSRLLAVRLFS